MNIDADDWGDGVDGPCTIDRAEPQRTQLAPPSRYVPARVERPADLTPAEQGLLSQAAQAASHLLAHRQVNHLTKNEETPIQNATASLIYSAAYAAIA
jgi:hypothetical protein